MALHWFDDNKDPLSTLQLSFGGRFGSITESKVYLRNDDSGRYYTNLILSVLSTVYDAQSDFGNSGWSIKFLYGERRPTEAEWDIVRSAEPLGLPDIGSTLAADTYTYHPIWIRTYCPPKSKADIIDDFSLEIVYIDKVVGA